MLLFDGHLDLALNGVDWNRDLRCSVDDLRAQEKALGMTDPGRGGATLSFPEMKVATRTAPAIPPEQRAREGPAQWCLRRQSGKSGQRTDADVRGSDRPGRQGADSGIL